MMTKGANLKIREMLVNDK